LEDEEVKMTEKLFWENPYQVEFDGTVLKIDGNKVVLDKTCFFPRGGGQVGDIGEINGIRVVDTQKDDVYTVIHILEKEPSFKVGDLVRGKVDWERRYKIMKLHSAAHIVYYLMREVFGEACKPVSSGLLDDKKDRSDYFFVDKLDQEKLKQVEGRANEVIGRGYEIQTWSDEQDPNRRYWKIEIFPVMACGGTHPKNTREIGRIRIDRGKKPGSGKERIEISLT
jgi:Ser-tRNA(Ala) deacylase AlaX